MKLHLTQAEGQNLITGYGEGWVEINRKRYSHSLIVLPESIIEDWPAIDFESLTAEHFQKIAELKPEVVLLGTGAKHRFIHPRLTAPLTAIGISLECMDTAAACRTYNILMGEGRKATAALLL
ncbi:MAG: hypothetical protein CTY33_07960 [Methylotenera sp.]|nr:MAG: hypothetical protein CTY33_07960 [Methylotenera sp.]